MFTRVRRAYCGALAMAVVALLSACSASASGSGNNSGGMDSITVGALPVVDDVSVYIAQDEGIFKQNGLNVKIKAVTQSPQAIPEMQKGTVDIIGGGNYVSFISASAVDPSNPPFRLLDMSATCAANTFNVLALPSSKIQTPQDLAGKTIAVNVLTNGSNIQTLMINSVLQSDGVDPKTVHYVTIPFPQMAAALKAGKVDAMSAVEPFSTQAEQTDGAVPVLDQCTGPTASLPESGYFALTTWTNSHPQEVQRFQAAMAQAQEVADTNRQAVEKALLQYVPGLTAEEAGTLSLADFPTTPDGVQVNRVSDLMREAGILKNNFQASSLIVK